MSLFQLTTLLYHAFPLLCTNQWNTQSRPRRGLSNVCLLVSNWQPAWDQEPRVSWFRPCPLPLCISLVAEMPRSEAQSRLIFVIFVDLSLRIFTVCHYFFPLVTKVPLPPQKTQGPFGATISCASGWLIPSVALPKVTRCHGAMVPRCSQRWGFRRALRRSLPSTCTERFQIRCTHRWCSSLPVTASLVSVCISALVVQDLELHAANDTTKSALLKVGTTWVCTSLHFGTWSFFWQPSLLQPHQWLWPLNLLFGIDMGTWKSTGDVFRCWLFISWFLCQPSGQTTATPRNVNAANLPGVLWYLHNEVVERTPRKFGITNLVFSIAQGLRYGPIIHTVG